jgi:hypothetical protein
MVRNAPIAVALTRRHSLAQESCLAASWWWLLCRRGTLNKEVVMAATANVTFRDAVHGSGKLTTRADTCSSGKEAIIAAFRRVNVPARSMHTVGCCCLADTRMCVRVHATQLHSAR